MSYIFCNGSLGSYREFKYLPNNRKHNALPYKTRGPLNRNEHQRTQGEYHTDKDYIPKTVTVLHGQVRMVPVSSRLTLRSKIIPNRGQDNYQKVISVILNERTENCFLGRWDTE